MKDNKKTNPIKYEHKMKSTFSVEFPKKFNIKPWVIQKINKPNYSKGVWGNIKIDFIDPIEPSTSVSLFKIFKLFKENTNFDVPLFEIQIKTLDSSGEVIEWWVIEIKELICINFGELDYNNDEPQKPYLILNPLDCVLKK